MFSTVTVAGLGLIGGSMARSIRSACPETVIHAFEINDETVSQAVSEQVIDGANDPRYLAESDLLLLALFPQQAMNFVREHLENLRPGTVIIDCCGVKAPVCAFLAPLCKEHGLIYIGGHPMAGREVSGYQSSFSGLFHGASMILVPTEASTQEAVVNAQAYFRTLGFGRTIVTTPEHHDDMIAFTSQLVHLISNSYMKSPAAADHHGYSGGSYRDITRVAYLDPAMWTELFLWNRDALLSQIDIFQKHISEVRDALSKNDRDTLYYLLKVGSDRKKEVDLSGKKDSR